MPFYHKLGNIPPKRHTNFKKPNGDFYYEQLFGTIGLMVCLPTVITSKDQPR